MIPSFTLRALGLILCATSAHAAVIVSGPVSTPGEPCTITITKDIILTLQTDVTGLSLVFDDWVTQADIGLNASTVTPLAYSHNGGLPLFADSTLYDNSAGDLGDVSAADGFIGMPTAGPFTAGDTITFAAGTYQFLGYVDFNPLTVGTFTGHVFLIDADGLRISDIASVPEPATPLILLGSLTTLLLRRRNSR